VLFSRAEGGIVSVPDGPNHESELAELLAEVRSLRREIEAFKTDPSVANVARAPAYEVLVKSRTDLPPTYEVLVKAGKLPPDYAVAVQATPAMSPGYEVAVKALTPGETVLARPAYRPGYEVAVNTLPKLSPDYEVAVRTIPPGGEQLGTEYEVAVKAFHPKDAVVLPVAYPAGHTVGAGELPRDYEVAVRGPFVPSEDPARRKR
jgi:hypothetical protein